MSRFFDSLFTESETVALVKRMDLLPQLVRRQQEELIVAKVALPPEWLQEQRKAFLGDKTLVQVLQTAAGLKVILSFISSALRHCVVLQDSVSAQAWRRPFWLRVAARMK